MYRPVLQWPSPELKRISVAVESFDNELQGIVKDLYDTVNVKFGAGLAAPQIGIAKRVVIINCDTMPGALNPEPASFDSRMWVIINPELRLKGDDTTWREACLSVPMYGGHVKRKSIVDMTYQNIDGEKKTVVVEWPLSGCLQHECDHLDGILFIDRMKRKDSAEIRRKIARHRAENRRRAKKLKRRLRPEKDLIDTRMSHGPGKRKKKRKK